MMKKDKSLKQTKEMKKIRIFSLTPIVNWQCPFCPNIFRTKKYLKGHIKKCVSYKDYIDKENIKIKFHFCKPKL